MTEPDRSIHRASAVRAVRLRLLGACVALAAGVAALVIAIVLVRGALS